MNRTEWEERKSRSGCATLDRLETFGSARELEYRT
jgi:hypothetical protein